MIKVRIPKKEAKPRLPIGWLVTNSCVNIHILNHDHIMFNKWVGARGHNCPFYCCLQDYFNMFYIIRIFAIGLFLGIPKGSLGIKCYYNNNGQRLNIKLKIFYFASLPLVPMGEVRDDPPVECQDETNHTVFGPLKVCHKMSHMYHY